MGAVLAHLRSVLFAPGSDERKLRKALATGADAVVADLEDAVAPSEKDAARALVSRVFAEIDTPSARVVRINGIDSPFWRADVEACGRIGLDAIVLPKATPEAATALGPDGPPLIAIVETALGLKRAYEMASAPRVAALALGALDLGAELSLEPRADGLEILYARSQVVVDSGAAGIRAPFDVVYLDTRDDTGLEREALVARSLGFGGKLCIHPAQVEVVNRVYEPTDEQVAWARATIAAHESGLRAGRGAVAVDGVMIDQPVVERARKILAAAAGRAGA